MEDKEKRTGRSTFNKVLMGLIIGGAVGSVVGVTVSNKDIRDKIRQKLAATSDSIREIVEEKKPKEEKKGFWYFLHRLFHRD